MIDPFVRLRLEEFNGLSHRHLYSEVDGELPPTQHLSGYTEWISNSGKPALSFSWDWNYDRGSQRLQAEWDSLRTNLKVIDQDGADLGDDCTRLYVARQMDQAQWERVIADTLGLEISSGADSRH